MNKTTMTLLGAAAALVPGAVSAAPAAPVASAASYAELLSPIPNALEALATADDLAAARGQQDEGLVQPAGWRHHHHHRAWRRRYHHHHHHHHRHW